MSVRPQYISRPQSTPTALPSSEERTRIQAGRRQHARIGWGGPRAHRLPPPAQSAQGGGGGHGPPPPPAHGLPAPPQRPASAQALLQPQGRRGHAPFHEQIPAEDEGGRAGP